MPAAQLSIKLAPDRVKLMFTGGLPVTVMEALVPVTPFSVALTEPLPL